MARLAVWTIAVWIRFADLKPDDFLFRSRVHEDQHIGTRRYLRIVLD